MVLGTVTFLQNYADNSGNGLVRTVVQIQIWSMYVNIYVTARVYTAVHSMPFSADPETQIDWKASRHWEGGAGRCSVTVAASGPLAQLRKCRKGVKTQAVPERPHTTYAEVFQCLGKNNGRCRKQQLLPFHSLRAAADLSHCLSIS